ncbi:VWA domain-containing protein [Nocardioides marmoriginsengisoli]|uniref:VWA domain-containing protein n=1 Tax=Nocardioides marmoriginsengisoli TaxID=661483 RepID=A0A3N0CAP9_9ACTN|nr:VWA domain-containing protein [Nocardioides marmoriginsengisoli]RNL60537.1 VWA domain-containing protein [Nocardioides marmoriginsengisoli]
MTLLDRHIAFVEALRSAGLPVSLSEGLDAADAVLTLGLHDREGVRAAYAATLVKRQPHRAGFDHVFDLYFPALVGDPTKPVDPDADPDNEPAEMPEGAQGLGDGPADLAAFRDDLVNALGLGDPDALQTMAREAVQRFGLIRGRAEGEQRWSSYNVMNRVSPGELVDRVLQGLLADLDEDPTMRRLVEAQVAVFSEMVDAEVRRRAAEVRGPEHVAKYTVRKSIDQIDFTSARKADLEEMRREIGPLARRLATRLNKHKASRQRGPLDFRRTVRASVSSGGVPLDTHHRPRRPSRSDLVVLCDVSGSVANFANFTLMLVFALREQFNRVRAFTFVDEIHEVSDRFHPGADPIETMASLAASAQYASLWGRTNYGRAFTRFTELHADALGPKTNLLILGDARSNYSDLGIDVLQQMVKESRHAWWLNPESPRHWNTGDSGARDYEKVVKMIECRNLVQLGDFIHDLA